MGISELSSETFVIFKNMKATSMVSHLALGAPPKFQNQSNDIERLCIFVEVSQHTMGGASVASSSSSKKNTVSIHDDNLEVVDLEALTPSSSDGKCPIDIFATTDSLEWSSSKGGDVPATFKIPKMEKLNQYEAIHQHFTFYLKDVYRHFLFNLLCVTLLIVGLWIFWSSLLLVFETWFGCYLV